MYAYVLLSQTYCHTHNFKGMCCLFSFHVDIKACALYIYIYIYIMIKEKHTHVLLQSVFSKLLQTKDPYPICGAA